jgi:hypothetical protein
VEQLLDRIVETGAPTVIAAYEKRIRKLEERKIVIGEQMEKSGRPVRSFEETVRTALEFLATPCLIWNSEPLEVGEQY